MFDFVSKQFEKIVELFQEEESFPRDELINRILKITGNILFVITISIFLWKGVFFLYEHYFPASPYTNARSSFNSTIVGMIKRQPMVAVFLIGATLFVVRIIVAIKVYIRPFYILSFIGIALLIKKLWVVAFTNDYESYKDFLADFAKDLFI